MIKAYTKEDLQQHLLEFVKTNKRIPTSSDTGKSDSILPYYGTYARIFGSWRLALESVGLGIRNETILKEYKANPTLCACCHVPLEFRFRKNRFCSKSCSARITNLESPKRTPTNSCKKCQKLIRTGLRYCCDECRKSYLKTRAIQKTTPRTNTENVKQWRMRFKQKAVDHKGGKCLVCNYKKCLSALEFHHLDANAKDFTISQQGTRKWELFRVELDKCVVLCSNCHRETHAKLISLEQLTELETKRIATH